MDPGYEVAASSLRARSLQLERVAHDLAHASTTAYKPERVAFALAQKAASEAVGGAVALVGLGAQQSQGALRTTGRALDVALQGNGFLAVRTPAGDRVTRDGRLQVGADGTLQSLDGLPILGRDNQPLRVDAAGGEVTIAADGMVRQQGRLRGQLARAADRRPPAGRPGAKRRGPRRRHGGDDPPQPPL